MKKIVFLFVVLLSICFSKDLLQLGAEAYIRGDYKTAAEQFEKTCDGGYIDSCSVLGIIYMDGQGVKQDYHKAAKLFEKACKGENAQGCYNLGFLYVKGQGVRQDYRIAKEYFGESCDLGHQNGCDAYKKLNEKGF